MQDPVAFLRLADEYIAKVGSALGELQTDNPAAKVDLSKSKAALSINGDTFEVVSDLRMQALKVSIPRLGQFRYFYDAENSRWVGEDDGHLLEELLVRELMRVTQGYLKL